ncbi:MAG: hypothetical protein GY868_21990 [Deltaproteobacteria bacterium]|nr:hypothetical protein [Deltaproteobacteria bacterium]
MSPKKPTTTHSPEGKGQFLVCEDGDGRIKIDVRLADETVWLTQPLMAELFQTTQQNISQHILNIYEEEELNQAATHKKFLSVRREGSRDVQRNLDFYNLDMIISVGYRVKSHVATRFRMLLPFGSVMHPARRWMHLLAILPARLKKIPPQLSGCGRSSPCLI